MSLRLTVTRAYTLAIVCRSIFCPRSVMLYVISMRNHAELAYRGGQEPIVHLEADLRDVVAWANGVSHSWAFTTSNAGSYYFNDYSDLAYLNKINWDAIAANDWRGLKEGKQAEFLVEYSFPWNLVSRIGVFSTQEHTRVIASIPTGAHQPTVQVKRDWYY